METAVLNQEGSRSLALGDWPSARAAFERSLSDACTAEALDGLGQALWWQNELVRALELREAAYAEFVRRGERAKAGAIAVFLAREYFTVHGNLAATGGWMGRAQTMLDDAGLCPEVAWLELTRGRLTHDPAAMEAHARKAIELAKRFDDGDLAIAGLSLVGLARVYAMRVDDGMACLDEAMAAASGGELDSFWTVADVYCNTLLACERAGDFERAEQWCRVIQEFSRKHGCQPMFPFCHVTHAAILTATGRWADADGELVLALDAFDTGHRAMRILALARLADLRLRQGRIEDARELLVGVEEHPLALRPAARLWILDDHAALAAETIERRLDTVGTDSLLAVPLLALLIDARLHQNDHAGAHAAATSLWTLAANAEQEALEGEARLALGRVQSAAGEDGSSELARALEIFSRLELPFETARARLDLAHAWAAERPELALGEARLALAALERLGATRDAREAASLVRRLGGGPSPGPRRDALLSQREQQVAELLGAGLSNREIADRLFLSVKTVEHHVSSVLAKLGLRSRAQVAAVLARRGGPTD